MKHCLAAIGLSAALILAPPLLAPGAATAAAQDSGESDNPSELAREGVARLMRALEALIESIPQYEMPEINEHGDIIIRRKRSADPLPDGDDDGGGDGDLDQTQT